MIIPFAGTNKEGAEEMPQELANLFDGHADNILEGMHASGDLPEAYKRLDDAFSSYMHNVVMTYMREAFIYGYQLGREAERENKVEH